MAAGFAVAGWGVRRLGSRRLLIGPLGVVAVTSGGRPPRPLVIAAVVLSVAGIALTGIATDVPLWVLALLLAALGIGLGNTGSLGLLVEACPSSTS